MTWVADASPAQCLGYR